MYPIYCINLDHRKDRKEHSLDQFKKLDISHDKVIYPYFTKDKRGGVYGCFDSHIKVWNDFLKYPNQKYCLVFEDDFVICKNSKLFMKKAVEFIEKNYKDIDILFLHDLRVDVENKINNNLFTNGYGLGTHSYFITRHYIQSIIKKYGKLPEPNGKHIDNEMNQNKFSQDNWLYTEKIFFTNKECMKQLEEAKGKSDNMNLFDKLFRQDINSEIKLCKESVVFMKKLGLLNNDQSKMIVYRIGQIITSKLLDNSIKI